jgi:hypothetical protein
VLERNHDPIPILRSSLILEKQMLGISIINSDLWESAQWRICGAWKRECVVKITRGVENPWLSRMNLCKPWQFAHMANIALYVENAKNLLEEPNILVSQNKRGFLKKHIAAIAEALCSYSLDEKKEIFQLHEELLLLGPNRLRLQLPQPWPSLEWEAFFLEEEL